MNPQKSPHYLLFIACLIVATGLFGREIYLPSLPEMSKQFVENTWLIPNSLTAYLIGIGISQLFYGPISDIRGRKKVLLFGIIFYLIGNILTCFSETSLELWLFRFFAGLGGGVCPVITRAILCDAYKESKLTKALAWLSIVTTVAPASAPIIGGYLQMNYGWQSTFVFICVLTLISFFLLVFFVPETNKITVQKTSSQELKQIKKNLKAVCSSSYFWGLTFISTLSYAIFVAYAMISPYYFQDTLGFTPLENGYLFCFIVFGYLLGAILASKLSDYFSETTNILIGLILSVSGTCLMLLFYIFGDVDSISVLFPLTITMMGSGLLTPNITKLSLNLFPESTGTASAVHGSIRMLGSFVFCLPLAFFDFDSQTLLLISIAMFNIAMVMIFVGMNRSGVGVYAEEQE